MRECNQAGVDLIKFFEGCKLKAYQDQNGVWTIGYGHTGPEVVEGLVWTQEQADAQFLIDLRKRATDFVDRVTPPTLSSNQFSALVSLCYNIGVGNFERSSTLGVIKTGWLIDVPSHILLWDKAAGATSAGLVRRRAAEVALWNQPDEVSI